MSRTELPWAEFRQLSDEAHLILDPHGVIVEADTQAGWLLNVDRRFLVGKPLAVYVALPDRRTLRLRLLAATQEDAETVSAIRLTARDRPPREVTMRLRRSQEGADRLLVLLSRRTELEEERARSRRLARTESSQRAAIQALRSVLQPEHRTVPDVDIGLRDVSAHPDAPIGGDLTDVLVLPDGSVHVSVVDVTGHGVTATHDAVVFTHTLRTIALLGAPMAELLPRTEALVRQQIDGFSAAGTVLRYEPASGHLTAVGAGQPPLLLVPCDGGPELVDLPGRPLGFEVGPPPRPVELDLGWGGAVVVVTDGILGTDPDTGLARLLELGQHVRSCDADSLAAWVLTQSLGEHARGEAPADDATALVLQRRRSSGQVPAPDDGAVFTADLGPQVADTSAVRLRLARWLDGIGIEDHEAVDDVLLIVSELSTNAIRVARTQAHVRVALGPGVVEVEVRDDGPGLPPEARAVLEASAPAADRLRGLYLVSELSDHVTVATGAAGTVIRCRRRR